MPTRKSLLAPYHDLPRGSRRQQRFVAEGALLVERLLASDHVTESVLVSERMQERIRPLVPDGVPLLVESDAKLHEITGFRFHRGVLACGIRKPPPALATLLPERGPVTLVACIGVQNDENLGSLLRTCAALGLDAVWLGPGCADPFYRRVLRVSMGASLRLPIRVAENPVNEFTWLRDEAKIEFVATVLDSAAEPLDAFERPDRLGLVFGNEGTGLSDDWLAQCSRKVTLPMQPDTDSLNVGVAAGIFLYHVTR